MSGGSTLLYVSFVSLVVWLVSRALIAAHYAAKRRYMRDLMYDLENGEIDGQAARQNKEES